MEPSRRCNRVRRRAAAARITGLTRFFRGIGHPVKMILADPQGSVLARIHAIRHVGTAGSWQVEGIGEDFVPPIADLSGVSEAYSIDDKESFAAARELFQARRDFRRVVVGDAAGGGASLLPRAARRPKRVVTFVCDTGAKYLSKMYDDFWMADQGLLDRAPQAILPISSPAASPRAPW